MKDKKKPCYKCEKRTPECHGSCEEYKAAYKRNRVNPETQYAALDYTIDQINKCRRREHLQNRPRHRKE